MVSLLGFGSFAIELLAFFGFAAGIRYLSLSLRKSIALRGRSVSPFLSFFCLFVYAVFLSMLAEKRTESWERWRCLSRVKMGEKRGIILGYRLW